MTNKQRIELQISEHKTKINDILKQETRSQEDLNQLTELTTRSQNLEIEYRAAVVSEGQEEQRALGEDQNSGDGETAELRSLFSRVSLNDYLAPASAGTGVDGAAKELNAALGVSVMGPSGGVAVPFHMLMERQYIASRNWKPEPTRTRQTMMDKKRKGQFCNVCLLRVFSII